MLPNFVIIGAMKSGTTSLWLYLDGHPQVFVSRPKEPDFFNYQKAFDTRRDWYEQLFAQTDGAVAIGEASTGYTKFPVCTGTAERMAATVPDARLIYLVRDPIERIRSQYLHLQRHGRVHRPINEVVADDPKYIDVSRYWMQLEQYLARFPREQILVLRADALQDERDATLARVASFLGIDPGRFSDNTEKEFHRAKRSKAHRLGLHRVAGTWPYRMVASATPERIRTRVRTVTSKSFDPTTVVISPEVRRRLEDGLHEDMAAFKRFMGPDFDPWGLA